MPAVRVTRDRRCRFELDEFLSRPLMAHLATRARNSARDSPLWYLWEDRALWFIVEEGSNTFQRRVARHPGVAVGVVDLDPHEGRLQHVGVRGRAEVAPWDDDRASRLLRRYYSQPRGYDAPPRAPGETVGGRYPMRFVRVVPETIVMREQSYRDQVLRSSRRARAAKG